jgi:hypothetical protein
MRLKIDNRPRTVKLAISLLVLALLYSLYLVTFIESELVSITFDNPISRVYLAAGYLVQVIFIALLYYRKSWVRYLYGVYVFFGFSLLYIMPNHLLDAGVLQRTIGWTLVEVFILILLFLPASTKWYMSPHGAHNKSLNTAASDARTG